MLSPDTKRVIRTVLQVVVGLASALPLLVHTADLPDTLPGLGVALAVSAAVTKAMAAWNMWLPDWLRLGTVPSAPTAKHAAAHPSASGLPADQVYTPVTQSPVIQSPDVRPDPAHSE